MASNGNSAGSVLVGFALGAITGAAVALLFAPASGEETRRKLADKAREGRDRAEEFAREGRDYVRSHRDNIVSAVERGREAFEQARKETL
jgi:gas vesicle protein